MTSRVEGAHRRLSQLQSFSLSLSHPHRIHPLPTSTMQKPENEIVAVVLALTASPDPDVQKRAVEQYYAPDVKFRHPLCSANDRTGLLAIYQWYRIMSPAHSVTVSSVTFDQQKLELFLDVSQTFHLRWSPLPPAPARLVVHLRLRPADPRAPADKTTYLIAEHEDFYHQEDLAALLVPPLVPLVRAALSTATLACRVLSFGFSRVLGYWRVRD
ncbi:hypothetical protein BD311DRAFT_701791, partial [Dichomitus squalens]